MVQHSIRIRVRYAETDQMGVVYYGNYAQYLEVARVETLRKLGLSYKELEERGVVMPVYEYVSKFVSSASYDELIEVRIVVEELPKTRMTFHHKIYGEKGNLINKGHVTLVFLDSKTKKLMQCPEDIYALFVEEI